MNGNTSACALLVLSGLLLSACGGGGGDPPVVIPPNQAPQFTSAATVSLVENAALIYQATATDANGDALTYTIDGGADAGRFSITPAGALTFRAATDFDNPADADGNNVYQVTLSVSDGRTTASLPVSITVTNSREGIAVRRVFSGFTRPTAIIAIPGDTRLFVGEDYGAIYYFDPATRTRTLYARLPEPSPGAGVALSGMTVSPGYASDGLLYTSDVHSGRFLLRAVDRAKVEAGAANPVNELGNFVIHPAANPPPPAGWIGFGPDGNLYATTGGHFDRDVALNDQSTTGNYRGKLVRIRPNPAAGGSPQYFFDVVAVGLFAPYSATFSGNTLLIGDQGRASFAEINRFEIGSALVRYGYPFRDSNSYAYGTEPANLTGPVLELPQDGLTFPVSKQSRQIILGPIYSGPVASLRGQLIFGDNWDGDIWTMDAGQLLGATATLTASAYSSRKADFAPDVGTIDRIKAFAATADGKLFILDADGDLFEVTAET